MLRDWDHTEVRDFGKLDQLWELHKNDDETVCGQIAGELNQYLGTGIVHIDERQSRFFKNYISRGWHNRGPTVTERQVMSELREI
jgi:hypothetical protein